jgi:hypothetical protein
MANKSSSLVKEIMIVVCLGLVIALIITAVLYWRSSRERLPTTSVTPTATPMTALPEKTPLPIEFLSPENESVFTSKEISISGRTFPNTPVVIFLGDTKSFVTQSDHEGNFNFDLNLESGSNILEAIVVDEFNHSYSDTRSVVLTTKSLEEILLTEAEVLQEATDAP